MPCLCGVVPFASPSKAPLSSLFGSRLSLFPAHEHTHPEADNALEVWLGVVLCGLGGRRKERGEEGEGRWEGERGRRGVLKREGGFTIWLCGTHECTMVSTIPKPLSAQNILCGNW